MHRMYECCKKKLVAYSTANSKMITDHPKILNGKPTNDKQPAFQDSCEVSERLSFM